MPAFALSNPDADQIERLAELGEKVRVRLYSSASYVQDAHSQNVVAEVRGRVRPQEVVLLGAHLDSWDEGTGAIDDGTGMAIITAAPALIRAAPQRPQRTVRLVLFGSEEIAQPVAPYGAFGGHAYCDGHKAELATHVLAGESDSGADRVYRVGLPQAVLASDFARTALRVLMPVGVIGAAYPPTEAGTDVGPSVEAGAPPLPLRPGGGRHLEIPPPPHHTPDQTDRAQHDPDL